MNPIQQAVDVLQELHDEGEISPQKLNPVLTSLRSLQKEVEGVELPEPDLYTWGATNPNAYSQSAVRTAVAAALGRGVVPSGWKLVPVEPTPEMRKAAADAWLDCDSKLFLNKAGAAVRAAIAISKGAA